MSTESVGTKPVNQTAGVNDSTLNTREKVLAKTGNTKLDNTKVGMADCLQTGLSKKKSGKPGGRKSVIKDVDVVVPQQTKPPLFLDELQADVTGTIIVMVGRVWDVNAVTGRYLSTDFVVSDSRSNMIHCTAKATIAHNFLRLKEGGIYSVKNFVVLPNKDEFRIFKHDAFMVEFDGETTVRKVSVKETGFLRYPFQLVDFDHIVAANNKYLIDVTGYVTDVGRVNYTKSGSKNLDFYLANQRGQSIRVTLWGGLSDVLIERKTKHVGVCAVVLTSVSPKIYNNKLYLSSSSSTTIYDSDNIPCLQELKAAESSIEQRNERLAVDFSRPREGSLENLLIWARNRKNDTAVFHCKVMIENFRTKKGWNYPSCGAATCRKGVTRQNGQFMCEAWNKTVDYPVFRYRLEVVVADDTAHTVVVMFNETATELLKCSAESLLGAGEDMDDEASLPTAIRNLIGTTHVLEIKSHTYYEYGTFESFTCWKINPSAVVDDTVSSSGPPPADDSPGASKKRLMKHPSICTPSKPNEERKQPITELEDSDVDEVSGQINESDSAAANCALDKKKKRRMIEKDYESE